MQVKHFANRLVEPTNPANTATNTMLDKTMIAEYAEIIFRSHKSLQDNLGESLFFNVFGFGLSRP